MLSAGILPESVNWVEQGKVSPPLDQSHCGGCWAFCAATCLESLAAIINNMETMPSFSVQYLLDCDNINDGCKGGWMDDSYLYT